MFAKFDYAAQIKYNMFHKKIVLFSEVEYNVYKYIYLFINCEQYVWNDVHGI